MAHRAHATERRVGLLHEVGKVVSRRIGVAKPSATRPSPRSQCPVRASEACTCQLPPSLGPPDQAHDRAEREQVPGCEIERLRRQRARFFFACRRGLGVR